MHFLAIDTDAWGFDEVAYTLPAQYAFVTQDLKAVDRSITPWVVLMGHRPMYCSSSSAKTTSRLGWPKQKQPEDGDGGALGSTPPPPPPPADYGFGFRAQGVEPPPWFKLNEGGGDDDAWGCGIGDNLRNGMVSDQLANLIL